MAKKKKTAAKKKTTKTAQSTAKSSTTKRKSGKASGKADATALKIIGLAGKVMKSADKKRDPEISIPMRTLSNANYNKKKRIIEMGDKAATRNFFDLNKSKNFMNAGALPSASRTKKPCSAIAL